MVLDVVIVEVYCKILFVKEFVMIMNSVYWYMWMINGIYFYIVIWCFNDFIVYMYMYYDIGYVNFINVFLDFVIV